MTEKQFYAAMGAGLSLAMIFCGFLVAIIDLMGGLNP